MKLSMDYRKYNHRVLTDDGRLHLDEINGTLEQTGKNEDGTYNFILTVPTRRYKRRVTKCKRYMFGALGFRVRNRKYKFIYLFGFKDATECNLFYRLVNTGGLYNIGRYVPGKDNTAAILKYYDKDMKMFDAAVEEEIRHIKEQENKKK